MANPPAPSWGMGKIQATWRDGSGTPKAGTFKVSTPVRVVNNTDRIIIPADLVESGPLSVLDGEKSLDVSVPATTDPDNREQGWKLVVEVSFQDGSTTERYAVEVGVGAVVNLADVDFPAPTAPVYQGAQYQVGVPGGIARLNAAGQVVDAQGNPVSGGGLSSVPSATASVLGGVKLAGDLGGRADAPVVVGLADLKTQVELLSNGGGTGGGITEDRVLEIVGVSLEGKADKSALTTLVRQRATRDIVQTSATAWADAITLDAEEGAEYDFSFYLITNGDPAADIKLRITGPAGTLTACVIQSLSAGAGAVSGGHTTQALTALNTETAPCGAISDAVNSVIKGEGWYRLPAGVAGTVRVQFVQAVNTSLPVRVLAGSLGAAVKVV